MSAVRLAGEAVVLVAAAIGIALASCSSKECDDIGCIDGAWLTLRDEDGVWTDGEYVLSVEAAGRLEQCSLRLPDELPASSGALTPLSLRRCIES